MILCNILQFNNFMVYYLRMYELTASLKAKTRRYFEEEDTNEAIYS